MLTSRKQRKTIKKLQPLNISLNGNPSTLADTIQAIKNQGRTDLSVPVTKKAKKYNPSRHYYKKENIHTMMKKIKETPSHMRDYKNNLETTYFKMKLGLERNNVLTEKPEAKNSHVVHRHISNMDRLQLNTEIDTYDAENTLLRDEAVRSSFVNKYNSAAKKLDGQGVHVQHRYIQSTNQNFSHSFNQKRAQKLKPLVAVREVGTKSNLNSPIINDHMKKLSDILKRSDKNIKQLPEQIEYHKLDKNRKSALGYNEQIQEEM